MRRMQRSGARCRAAAGALTPSPVAARAVVRSSARATGSTLVLNAAMMTVTRSFQSMVPPHAGRAHWLLHVEAPPLPPVTSKEKMHMIASYGYSILHASTWMSWAKDLFGISSDDEQGV